MTGQARLLCDCIEIKKSFLRSVNLEKDYETISQNGDYIITPTAIQILRRVSEGLNTNSQYRSWTVTGPYGVGKSAFAVYMTQLLCQDGPAGINAWTKLKHVNPALVQELAEKGFNGSRSKGMLPVLVTARRAPSGLCLLEGLQSALRHVHNLNNRPLVMEVNDLVHKLQKGQTVDSRRITMLASAFTETAEITGYKGVLLLVDEMGKLFEYAARMPHKGDVFIFQELAEQVNRSGKFPMLILGFLHQAFEEYGHHLDSITRTEWSKIHGRFEDIAFLEPADQIIRMVAGAIKWTGDLLPKTVLQRIKRIAEMCSENGVSPPGMHASEFVEICQRVYPLHPVTLVALPFLFRRFAQNERSIFSYLRSLEPSGFQDFLKMHKVDAIEENYLRLHHLFDYFTVNLGSGLYRHPHAKRWLEAAEVLERKENLTQLQTQLVKTIGVLGALGEFSHLSAQASMISQCLADKEVLPADLNEGLTHLKESSILTYRRYNNTYRIWEGSDVDIDERILEGERKTRGVCSLAAGIQRYLEPGPFVARRHSFETGALRYFSVTYVDDPSLIASNLTPASGAAGQLLVCLSMSKDDLQAFQEIAKAKDSARLDIVFAIPQQIGEIQSDVTEITALHWVSENTPELRDDRVARREVSLRITQAEHFLRHHLSALLDPRKEPLGTDCRWFWNGQRQKVQSRVDVSFLLSKACDEIYSQTPKIRNELIVRRTLSSAAAAARRNLIDKMLTNGTMPCLGIESYPPERSIYESVVKATGLHCEMGQGFWGFADPTDKWLAFAWDCLRQAVFDNLGEPKPLDMIFQVLAEAPLGVMDGLHPILLCAFLQVYRNETSLYRDGTFIPEPTIADFEVLMRRPELFAVAGSHVAGTRAAVVERMAKGFQTEPATVPVVRALFKMVRQLPDLARRTTRLTERTIHVREAFEKAKAPEKLLYVDLPAALALPPLPDDGPSKQEIERFFNALNECLQEWLGVTEKILSEAKHTLLRACGFDASDDGWQQLRETATRLEPREGDPQLQQFLRRVVESSCDEAGILSVLGLVSSRPPASWMDIDVERFPNLAGAIGDLTKRARRRAGLSNEPSAVLASLNRDQRERAKSLAHEMERKMGIASMRTPRDVTRAALLLIAERLAEESEGSE